MSVPGALWRPTKLWDWVMAEYQWSTVLVACPRRPSPGGLAKSKWETPLWPGTFVAQVRGARTSRNRILPLWQRLTALLTSETVGTLDLPFGVCAKTHGHSPPN